MKSENHEKSNEIREEPLGTETLREMARKAMEKEPPPLPDSLKMRQHPPLKK